MIPSSVIKPAVNVMIVSGIILALHDPIPDAGVRSAIGWCTAAAVVETAAHIIGRRRRRA